MRFKTVAAMAGMALLLAAPAPAAASTVETAPVVVDSFALVERAPVRNGFAPFSIEAAALLPAPRKRDSFVNALTRALKRRKIHAAVRPGGDRNHRHPSHRRGGGVCAMGGVRHDDLRAGHVAPRLVVGLDHQKPRLLAVSARRGLESHIEHAGHFAEDAAQTVDDFETPLRVGLGLQRVDAGEAGEGGHLVVDLGVVLHRAGAQRVEPVVDAVGAACEKRIMAADLGLREGREPRGGFPH